MATDALYLLSPQGGRLDGIDRETDRAVWQFPDYWQIESSDARDLDGIYGAPIIAEDGDTVYMGDYNGFIYTFKLSDALTPEAFAGGATKPMAAYFEVEGPVIGGLALDEAGETLYVAAGKRLYALNTADLDRRYQNPGAEIVPRWTFSTEKDIWTSPVLLDDGRILVASLDGSLYAVDGENGQEAWQFDAGASGLVSTPTIVGDTVLVGSFNSRLYAVNAADGVEKWAFQAKNWVWSQPKSEDGTLYFGDFSGYLYAIETETGEQVWSADLGRGQIVAAPLLVDGVIVVATEDGWLIGLNPEDQAKIWERNVGTAINADPVLVDGRVIFAPRGCVTPEESDQETYFFAVNPETGELERALDVC